MKIQIRVKVEEVNTYEIDSHDLEVGQVPEDYLLSLHRTDLENIMKISEEVGWEIIDISQAEE